MAIEKVVAIVIVRMGSTRMPGKCMAMLGSPAHGAVPVVEWCVRACGASPEVDEVWLATTVEPRDDVFQEWANYAGVSFNGKFRPEFVHRGPELDVLTRVYDCAVKAGATIVVRVTGDCPFLDPTVISGVVRLLKDMGAAYASNVIPPTWPDGLDVEAFRFEALEAAYHYATLPSDRETVTQWIVRNVEQFPAESYVCPLPGLHLERWVLDTPEDIKFCGEIAARLPYYGGISHADILKILEREPALRKINSMWGRNERFFASLSAETDAGERLFIRSGRNHNRGVHTGPLGGASTYSKSHVAWGMGNGPLFATRGMGSAVFDSDGNRYIDWTASLLTIILGYAYPDIDEAIRRQLCNGIILPLGSHLEIALAEKIKEICPWCEMSVFGKNGSDVCTAAVRLARAATGREIVLLMTDAYHGWHDWALAWTERAHGVTRAENIWRVEVDNVDAWASQPAAIIIEGEQPPEVWARVRQYCDDRGALMLVDEMITGIRSPGFSASWRTGVKPDLTCFGKPLGNGMPISVLGGHRKLMQQFAPGAKRKNAFYSGTFFGEQLSIAAALEVIRVLQQDPNRQESLVNKSRVMAMTIDEAAKRQNITVVQDGSIINRYSFPGDPRYAVAFRHHLAQAGVLSYNSWNTMLAHTDEDMHRSQLAVHYAMERLAAGDIDYHRDDPGIMRR